MGAWNPYSEPEEMTVSPEEQHLLWYFSELNDDGRFFLMEVLRALVCTGILSAPDPSEELAKLREGFMDRLRWREKVHKDPPARYNNDDAKRAGEIDGEATG